MSEVAATIAARIQSIMQTPQSVLPDGPARRWVFVAAVQGRDVYVYRAAGSGRYNLWLSDERLCLEPQGNEVTSEFARWWATRFPGVPMVAEREGGAA